MNKQLEQVKEWHEKYKVPIGEWSHVPPNNRIELRSRLLEEEGFELRMALQKCKFDATSLKSEVMGNMIKEICDVIYVCYGTLLEFGLHPAFEKAFDEVHASNMTKTIGVQDSYGKITKGDNFIPADMDKIFI